MHFEPVYSQIALAINRLAKLFTFARQCNLIEMHVLWATPLHFHINIIMQSSIAKEFCLPKLPYRQLGVTRYFEAFRW